MELYFAGGITGNLRNYFLNILAPKLYLAGNNGKEKIIQLQKDTMELYLAGNNGKKETASINIGLNKMELYFASNFNQQDRASVVESMNNPSILADLGITLEPWDKLNILESFFYIRDNKSFPKLIPYFENFLLDSGAFTFMQGSKGHVNWDDYVQQYADFVNEYDINKFFELDIDSIVGLKKVEQLRQKLEDLTHKKPIPVWHRSRGSQYFIQMCKDYKYVALGGIVSKEIPVNKYEELFPWFISTAHKMGCKIHGLGYTRINGLFNFKFDSVDSTAWLYGNRGGYLYRFNPRNKSMDKISGKEGKRFKSKETAIYNFNEWVKFQKYLR